MQRIQRVKLGQCGTVDGIGLGPLPNGFSEAPSLQKIDLDHGDAGRAELAVEAAMVSTGWLEDDVASQPFSSSARAAILPSLIVMALD